MTKRPFDLLNAAVGKRVLLGLKGAKEVTGRMTAFDIHMNIVIEEAEIRELENGAEKKNSVKEVFVRGDSLVYLSPLE